VEALLTDLAGEQTAENEWQIEGPCWIYLIDPPYWQDWEQDELDALEKKFGQRPSLMIHVNVSGRTPGHQEIETICTTLLEQGGIAIDDYSNDFWSLREILNDTKDQRRFFEATSNSGFAQTHRQLTSEDERAPEDNRERLDLERGRLNILIRRLLDQSLPRPNPQTRPERR